MIPTCTFLSLTLVWPAIGMAVTRYGHSLSPAGSSYVDRGSDGAVSLCSARALYTAKRHLAANDWESLRTNPCVGERIYDEIVKGERDEADSFEFLGKTPFAEFRAAPFPGTELLNGTTTKLPRVLFLGLPHSGSTSLAEEMNMHPELSYGLMKEHNMLYEIGSTGTYAFKKAYRSTFVYENKSVKYTFDASPATLFIADKGDQDMLKHHAIAKLGLGQPAVEAVEDVLGPDVKFIVMLRDPLDWQISMTPKSHREIDGYLNDAQLTSKRACYVRSIEIWIRHFGLQNFLFLESKEYFANPQDALDKVFSFLDVSPRQYEPEDLQAQGRRRSSRTPTTEERRIFWEDRRMQGCKRKLEQLTMRKWDWGAK